MKDTMRSKLTQLVRRLEEIDQNLQDPDVTSNMEEVRMYVFPRNVWKKP